MCNFAPKFLFSLFLLFPIISYAWNFTGHVVVAQIAYNQLSSEKKQKADEFASIIFNQLPETQQEKLNYQYPNASTFAKVAILPDVWRKWNLSTIFIKFHALPPMNLLLSLQEPTAAWHFIDTPYPQNKNCRIGDSKNVVWAINTLEKSLPNAKLKSSKALELVFLEHYIGDIHQPLHNVTNVSSNCEGDRGGNNFCLNQNKKGKCTKNLHSLWDSAVGYLKPHENIQQLAYELEHLHPYSQFTNQFDKIEIIQWSEDNFTNISFVYDTPEFSKPSPEYYRNGQIIAKSQLTLAGYRLANKLNEIL